MKPIIRHALQGPVKDLFEGVVGTGQEVFGGLKDNPFRAFVGSADPASTKLWNAILGRDDEPLVDVFGGTTDEQFKRLEARGINTGPKRTVDTIADTIAGFFAGQGLGNAAGNVFGGASGASPQGGFLSQVQTGGGTGPTIPGGFMSQVQTGGPQGFLGAVDTGGVQAGGASNPFLQFAQNLPGAQQGQAQQQASPLPLPGAAPGPAAQSNVQELLARAIEEREENERQRQLVAAVQQLLRSQQR